jgi:hypothetical protein
VAWFSPFWRRLAGPPWRPDAQVVRRPVALYRSSGALFDALAAERALDGAAGSGKYAITRKLHAGEVVPESGLYRVQHEATHADPAHVVTLIRGRGFPICPHCRAIDFELIYSDEADRRLRSLRRHRERRRRGATWRARMNRVREALARLALNDRVSSLGIAFARARFRRTTTQAPVEPAR